MLIRYSDWKKPTDEAYAFRLRDPAELRPTTPALGQARDIRDVAREALADGEAERFERRLDRWSGPEDVVDGEQPYVGAQLLFEERAPAPVTGRDLVDVLRGTVLVMRGEQGQTDYLLRDHHMLDVALYHYRTTGELPTSLFHADRHSDWCKDSYLEARRPQQAATWWPLFEGLKRSGGGAPVLRDQDIFFTTAIAETDETKAAGRNIGYARLIPYSRDPDALHWRDVLAQERTVGADWVSLDLDYFQPSAQLALTAELIRDPRFGKLMTAAKVRVFVLSPQFTRGGDQIARWQVQGSLSSSRRLINLLRRPGS